MTEKMQKIIQKCAERFDLTDDEVIERIFMSWLAGSRACEKFTGDAESFQEFAFDETGADLFAKIGELHDDRIRRIINEVNEIRNEVEGDSYIVADYCQKQGLDALAILDRIDSRVLAQAIRDGDKAKIDEAIAVEA